MKKLIYISCIILSSLVLASCEDMLTVDSSRYSTVSENDLASPQDSVYSVLGLLRQMQNLGERYVLYGELRADLMTVTDSTSAAIRAISDYSLSDTSSYANPRDYYNLINNCNYIISRTSAENNPNQSMLVAAHAVRAWTYMQVVTNWGQAYYITEPLLSVEDTQKSYPRYDIQQVVDALITDLTPFENAVYPQNYISRYAIPNMKLLLGDLYLWRGASISDYEMAATYYADCIADLDENWNVVGSMPRVYWSLSNFQEMDFETATPSGVSSWISYATSLQSSYVVGAIAMSTSAYEGKINSLPSILSYFDVSESLMDLWDSQNYVLAYQATITSPIVLYFTTGDARKKARYSNQNLSINNNKGITTGISKINAVDIILYRKPLIYLRYAEALNRAGKSHTAFAVLKYGLNPETFADKTIIPDEELIDNKPYITMFNSEKYQYMEGIHSIGCGSAAHDSTYVVGTYANAEELQLRVEDLICDELALETFCEGNRFGDLVRIALRRNDPSFFADKVMARNPNISVNLMDSNNWFLPLPRK